MSEPVPRQALQQRVAAAILDGAAHTFAVRGARASMVYRYFPNRESLLDELARAAVRDVDARLASARIDAVAPEEGIARAVRALVDVGDSFVLLARERLRSEPDAFEGGLTGPLREVFERGQAGGDFRADPAGTVVLDLGE